jgi:tetratricopeptide (TPR) repeat protein
MEYPRNLNAGRQTVHPSEAMVLYMLGVVAEAGGRIEEAKQHYTAAVSEVHYDGEPAQAYEMLAWLALGQWPRAMKLASRYERIGRGEAKPDEWGLWFNGRNSPKVGVGFAELVKGRLEAAREVWTKVLEEEPDARWMRPLLRMNDDLLRRMYARAGEFVATVWADSAARVERLTDAPVIAYQGANSGGRTTSGNGQAKCDCDCGCDCKTGKATKPAAKSASKKARV